MVEIKAYQPIEIHSFRGIDHGPNLLVLGGVHGNEPCGPLAIRDAMRNIRNGNIKISAGSVTFIPVCNPDAYRLGKRHAGIDLNREFFPVNEPNSTKEYFQNIICDIMINADVLLDLHSFKAVGEAFVFVGPENNNLELEPFTLADEELQFAQHLGIKRMVYGWYSTYAEFAVAQNKFVDEMLNDPAGPERVKIGFGQGTTEYFRSASGKYGVTLECGNHNDPASVSIAYNAITKALGFLQISQSISSSKEVFRSSFKFNKIFIRHHIDDHFSRTFVPFESVTNGEILAYRASGETVTAPSDGVVIFSYPDARVGKEWIYFAAHSRRGM